MRQHCLGVHSCNRVGIKKRNTGLSSSPTTRWAYPTPSRGQTPANVVSIHSPQRLLLLATIPAGRGRPGAMHACMRGSAGSFINQSKYVFDVLSCRF